MDASLVLTAIPDGEGAHTLVLAAKLSAANGNQRWSFDADAAGQPPGAPIQAYAADRATLLATVERLAAVEPLARADRDKCLASAEGLAEVEAALDSAADDAMERFETRPADRAVAAPTPALETPRPFRARVFKNGEVNERGAVTIVASIKVTRPDQLLDMFIEDARNQLALPNAGRCLFTREGKVVTRLDVKTFGPGYSEDSVPDLWLSQGEHFYPPDEHREVVLKQRNEAKADFKALHPVFQEDLGRLRKMVAKRK